MAFSRAYDRNEEFGSPDGRFRAAVPNSGSWLVVGAPRHRQRSFKLNAQDNLDLIGLPESRSHQCKLKVQSLLGFAVKKLIDASGLCDYQSFFLVDAGNGA